MGYLYVASESVFVAGNAGVVAGLDESEGCGLGSIVSLLAPDGFGLR